MIIGLTGGMASGKSTIAGILAELGALVVDADCLARDVTSRGQPILKELEKEFGPGVVTADGELLRRELARRVFDSPVKVERLNALIHPLVIARTRAILEASLKQAPQRPVVLDAPLLLESGMDKMVDEVWVAAVDEETQIQRIMERDGLPAQEARERISRQMPLADKLKRATRVIDTSGSLAQTRRQVLEAWREVAGD